MLAAAGLLVALVLGIGGWALFSGTDPATQRAAELLQASQQSVTDTTERAGAASKLRSLRAIGRDARAGAARLADQGTNLAAIDNPELLTEVGTALDARRRYLQAMAGLSALDLAAVDRPQVPRFESLASAADQALRQAIAAEAALRKRDLPGSPLLDSESLRQGQTALRATVLRAAEARSKYRAEKRRYEAALARARRNAGVIADYRTRVLGILAAYQRGRNAVDAATRGIDDADLPAMEARFLAFKADRESTIRSLEAAHPSAPQTARAGGAHDALVVPVSTSLQGLDAAVSAISSAYFADEPVTVQDTWPTFQDQSRQVVPQLSTAQSAWRRLVDGMESEARKRGVPPRPKAPDV